MITKQTIIITQKNLICLVWEFMKVVPFEPGWERQNETEYRPKKSSFLLFEISEVEENLQVYDLLMGMGVGIREYD